MQLHLYFSCDQKLSLVVYLDQLQRVSCLKADESIPNKTGRSKWIFELLCLRGSLTFCVGRSAQVGRAPCNFTLLKPSAWVALPRWVARRPRWVARALQLCPRSLKWNRPSNLQNTDLYLELVNPSSWINAAWAFKSSMSENHLCQRMKPQDPPFFFIMNRIGFTLIELSLSFSTSSLQSWIIILLPISKQDFLSKITMGMRMSVPCQITRFIIWRTSQVLIQQSTYF